MGEMSAHLQQFSTPQQPSRATSAARGYLPQCGAERIVGFFPGLGSRAAYQDLDRSLLDSGRPDVVGVYREGARALGFPDHPEKLLMVPANMPAGKREKEAFIGAALAVHNLALEAYLRTTARERGVPLDFAAYTGESFGILISAMASGSVSISDGIKIARVFTPLMTLAGEGGDQCDPLARELACYLPESLKQHPLVPEPFHVIGLRGNPEDLEQALEKIEKSYQKADVEVHKHYSPRQTNIYVRSGIKPGFDLLIGTFPAVRAAELKAPTTFLAHSERMRGVREALNLFIERNGIVVADPHTPVISNSRTGLLTTAAEVRDGVLAMTNEVMASRGTAQTLESLSPDIVLELGLGGKSVQLLADNGIDAPAMAYTGTATETDLLLDAVGLGRDLRKLLRKLRAPEDRLGARHYAMLRELFLMASRAAFCDRYFYHTMRRVRTDEMLGAAADGPPALRRFLETFQHTYHYRDVIDAGGGELVLRTRLKKTVTGNPARLGQAYTELEVLEETGDTANRCLTEPRSPEAIAVHLGWPGGPHDARAVDPVASLYRSFRLLRDHRPDIFTQSDHYLVAGDRAGWLAALAASGAASLSDITDAFNASQLARAGTAEPALALDRLSSSLKEPEVPVISPAGVPLQTKKDLAAATRGVLQGGALSGEIRRIHLDGNCQILALGTPVTAGQIDAGAYQADVLNVRSTAEISQKGANPALDLFEERCALGLTAENEKILQYARGRKMLSSTVSAYVAAGESVVGFGQGGSESMTMFVQKRGQDTITVRKILSEALTTVSWDPKGKGVMLPPFTKARRQAEYLQALPESVRRYFPKVYDVLDREIPVPPHLRTNGSTFKEVSYEMSYVPGDEVSRFVEKHSPPPAVIARLYTEIFRTLHQEIHAVNRVPAPGDTLEVSYFKKVEARLALCRRTAPRTFSPALLDTERIIVNGASYLNSTALIARFRSRPEFLRILEPRFHSLVVGDTNTENIKIADSGPLLRAQRLIEAGAPQEEIDAALDAITAGSVGIRFLDPRAIGFKCDGAETVDDPMYDNKPWHNCLGHYDEIHYEQFKLHVRMAAGRVPRVTVEFVESNPYQKAYRVRDLAMGGERPDPAAMARGMEDYFTRVMTDVYGLDDPESQYLMDDPYWLIRFVFIMGTHFTAMPPFHFQSELDGTLLDTCQAQRRPVAIYCEGIKWLNWALEMLEGKRTEFLGIQVPPLPYPARKPVGLTWPAVLTSVAS